MKSSSAAPAPTLRSAASQVPALQRGLALLELLAATPAGATLAELASALHLSSATVFRLAGALEELGYLQRDERTKRFSLTRRLLTLGQPHSGAKSLVECAIEPMRSILAATGETTQLIIPAGSECVLLEQLPSLHSFKYIVDLGSRVSAHCCAPGKAILAFASQETLDQALAGLSFERFTPHSITSRADFLLELESVRACGYATDFGEHFEGIHCLAAPLLDQFGHAFASITIAGPSTRVPQTRFAEWGALIRECCQRAAQNFLT
jgi:DNA-binding IclR family transcriptional regulator